MDHIEFWRFLYTELTEHSKAALVKVVSSTGSSPGRRGFMMAVSITGTIRGTIGGGVMEHRIIEEVTKEYASDRAAPVRKLLDHKKNVPAASGLTCTGSQTIAIMPLSAEDLPVIELIQQALSRNSRGILSCSPDGLRFNVTGDIIKPGLRQAADGYWIYEENYGRGDTVYVFGSGHVGFSVCKIFSAIGFQVIAIDPRAGAPTVLNNVYAHRIITIPFSESGECVEEGPESYIVIVTSDRDSDALVLGKLIHKDFAYIGLMGSAAKIGSIFKELRAAGVSEDNLKKVSSPIGIQINSTSPDEIAVSIAAQVIHIKNERLFPENSM